MDERTRLAISAMAQAKQDFSFVKHLAAVEKDRLETERSYLGRWKAELLRLSDVVETEAVQKIEKASWEQATKRGFLKSTCRDQAQKLLSSEHINKAATNPKP